MKFKQKLYQLKADRAEALKAADAAMEEGRMEDYDAEMAKIKDFNGQIDRVEKLLAEQERFGGEEPPEGGVPHAEQEPETKGYEAAVKSFAAAARAGFPKTKAAGDFLSEGVDSDGGYTVPEDISTKIIQFRESKESLLGEVTVAPVTTRGGKRTIKKRGQHQGFATVAEAAKFGKSATPQFALDGRSLFPAGDAAALAEKIDWWFEHPQEREEMGMRYGEHAKRYALDRSIEQTEEMFRTAIAEQRK